MPFGAPGRPWEDGPWAGVMRNFIGPAMKSRRLTGTTPACRSVQHVPAVQGCPRVPAASEGQEGHQAATSGATIAGGPLMIEGRTWTCRMSKNFPYSPTGGRKGKFLWGKKTVPRRTAKRTGVSKGSGGRQFGLTPAAHRGLGDAAARQ